METWNPENVMIFWKFWMTIQIKKFFSPMIRAKPLHFYLEQMVFLVVFFFFFFFFFTKSHLSCAFGSFLSFFVINSPNTVIALVFLKGFGVNVFSHLSCDYEHFLIFMF